ncbi:MAG TPA: N,N-dimethylformamidase beta subunit family domain-containing protein, partial [Myxococcales bacterium]|nr:N,N-dimethylformamidase beta subunit family domain-containing protein [Myxococcales bacterium]
VSVVNKDGDDVRTLADDVTLAKGRHRFRWDGRLDSGEVAPDGKYRIRVSLRKQARTVTSPRKLFVDTKPPHPVIRYVSPDAISPDGAGSANSATVRFDGPVRRRPTLLVFHSRLGALRLVAREAGRAGSSRLSWNGQVGLRGRERRAPSGNYLLVVRVTDAAGNASSSKPPSRGRVRGHPGLRVRYVEARAPLRPVRAGQRVNFAVASDGRRYRWSLRRVGSRRVVRRGSSHAHTLTLHAPRGRTGLYVLGLRVGNHRYSTPFAVQGRRRSRLLVVLPVASWQARNDLDADGDGYGDLLPDDRSVSIARPYAGTGLPAAFGAREGALQRLLDRTHRNFELTTDVGLTDPGARSAVHGRGLLFAGPPRFFLPQAASLAETYVRSGGRAAWLGTRGFTTPVGMSGTQLELLPALPARRNSFGERLRPDVANAALVVLADDIDFFTGVSTALGPFPLLEPSTRLPRGARLLAAAGHEAGRPSLVVYRDGRGIVARVGIDGFARTALRSPAQARIMARLWTLLSR